MNTSIKTKVNRIGLIGQIVSIVLIILMSVSIVALAAGNVILALLPKDAVTVGVKTDMDVTVSDALIGPFKDQITDQMLEEANISMRVNGTEFSDIALEKADGGLMMRAATDRIALNLSQFGKTMLAGLIYCVCVLVVFIFLKRLSDGFRRCDTPFAADVVKRMNVFAWVLLGCAVVSSFAESIANTLMMRNMDLEFSLNPANLNSGFHFSLNLAPIFVALVVLFLTMIFRYGAQLQQESDETL